MERTISVEEKIRRAEEIYERRKQGSTKPVATVSINQEKKDIKLLKKMIIQILICISIYLIIYTIQNSETIFSKDFLAKANEILSYDTNFSEIYQVIKNNIKVFLPKKEEQQEEQEKEKQEENNEKKKEENNEESQQLEGVGGAKDTIQSLTQAQQDIQNIKNTTTFIKPLEGIITSKFGQRDTATENIPINHTGTDIAANLGTKIKSSTDGEVVLASEEGDYGKHLKIQIGEISIIYAHCNSLYVKQGDMVTQGQEIAEVGSTGNSTGPHLHFEIRISERTVDPETILEL